MLTAATMPVLPWRKLAMTVIVAGAFAWFWVNGPLDEPQSVFEFEEFVTGFAEPVKLGEEYQTPVTGMVPPREEHAYYHVMAAREQVRPTWGIIGDARTNPGLTEEVARLVYDDARAVAANPDGVTLKSGLDLYYTEERDADGRVVQLYLENTGLNKDVKGYAGPIDLGLVVSPDGRIRSVRHLRSMETTSYLRDIEKDGFYERFANMLLDDQSHEVDAVTGASLTTEGFARSLTQLVSIARESPLEIYLDTKPEGFDVRAVLPDSWVLDAGLIVLLFVLASLRRVRRSPKLMLGLALACIVYLGFLRNNSFTYVTYLQPFMGVRWSWVLGTYAAAVLLGAIWDGNSYCRYICPYGNVQRLLLRVIPWHVRLPVSNRVLSAVRWLIAIALIIGIFSGLRDWGSYELFPDLFGLQVLESPWFWLSLAVVLVSAFFPMLWCRALCPTGAVLDTVTFLARPGRAVRRGAFGNIPVTVEPVLGSS